MWDRKADFIPFKPPFIRCFGIELQYADRKREQDFGVYQYHHYAALREGGEQETRKRHIRFREHRREMSDKEAEHQKEVSFLKAIILKAKKWFPLFQELVYGEVLPEWFKEQFNKLFSSIRRTVTQPRGIKL